jgi:hypothetical protein
VQQILRCITGSSPADESASGRARFDAVSDLSRDPGGSPAFAIHADWNSTSYRITIYHKDLWHNSHAQRHTDFFVQDGTVAVAPIALSPYSQDLTLLPVAKRWRDSYSLKKVELPSC